MIKRVLETAYFGLWLILAGMYYVITGRTHHKGFVALRYYYRLTNGRLNDLVGRVLGLIHPARTQRIGAMPEANPRQSAPIKPNAEADSQAMVDPLAEFASRPAPTMPVGVADSEALADEAVRALKQDGMYMFPNRLPEAMVDALVQFARTSPVTGLDGQDLPRFDPDDPSTFPDDAPLAARYAFSESTLLKCPSIRDILLDPWVLELSQQYLGFMPKQDLVTMWWSPARNGQPDSPAAQMFHYDMDRFRFLKLFVYLTDVGPDHGPHIFVPGSHMRKPQNLLEDRRYTDDEVNAAFPPSQTRQIEGPRGTMFLADTRALHKGKPPVAGPRLILQYEFADSLFGAPYTMLKADDFKPDEIAWMKQQGRVFQRFLN